MAYQPQSYVYQSPIGLEPTPPKQSWFALHKRLLRLLMVGLIFAVVILLIVVFFLNRQKANQAASQAEVVEQQTLIDSAKNTCDSKKNPDGCKGNVTTSLAAKTGKVSYCNGLTYAAYDNCIALAALQAKSLNACNLIKDSSKKADCLSTVTAILHSKPTPLSTDVQAAVDSKDPAKCEALADPNDQALCAELVGPGDADKDGLDAQTEAGLGTSDTNSDTDGDGLTDYDEVTKWHTDPTKADTDGDGYSDGQEVASGHNPLGSGKL